MGLHGCTLISVHLCVRLFADDIKKSLKDAKHKIQEKIEHHKDKAHDKPATGHA